MCISTILAQAVSSYFYNYDHPVAVAILCVKIASNLPLQTDTASLVRGALLHNYFLYDWHIADKLYAMQEVAQGLLP